MNEVSNTILAQLGGGNRVAAMIGVKRFGTSGNDLSIRFTARAKDKINYVRIVLDPSDTYTVIFSRVNKNGSTVVDTCSDVYCDVLREVIERRTGLYLTMGRVAA